MVDMDIIDYAHPNDRPVLELIFAIESVLYGGYLRDIIAGIPPTDIDAVIALNKLRKFDDGMKLLGYTPTKNFQHGTVVYVKPDALPVETNLSEIPPWEDRLIPGGTPDFDVNSLAYHPRHGLYDWTNPENPIDVILEHIESRVAAPIKPTPDRQFKMRYKGYRIIS